jgi:hypothetical protein
MQVNHDGGIEAQDGSSEGAQASRTAARAGTAAEPDLGRLMRAPSFQEQAHLQSRVVAASTHADEDQAFIDTVSGWGGE